MSIFICIATTAQTITFVECISSPLAPFTHLDNAEKETDIPNLHMKKLRREVTHLGPYSFW